MQAVLIQQKCEKALKGEGVSPVTMSQAEKTEMVDKVMSVIVLCLSDKVLRDVAKALLFQEEMVEVEVTEEAQRAVTRKSINALSVTRLVTS